MTIKYNPEDIKWSTSQWNQYIKVFADIKPHYSLTPDMIKEASFLFLKDKNYFKINKKLNTTHNFFNYATSKLVKNTIFKICEELNIYPIQIMFNSDLLCSSHKYPYIGTEDDPFICRVLIDLDSYSKDDILNFQNKMLHALNLIFRIRTLHKPYRVNLSLDDIHDFKNGYSEGIIFGADSKSSFNNIKSFYSNPMLIHGLRSGNVKKAWLQIAATESLAHKGELYLRWLDSKDNPDKVTQLDEIEIEKAWPGALNLFNSWAALGIKERKSLASALKSTELSYISFEIDNSIFLS